MLDPAPLSKARALTGQNPAFHRPLDFLEQVPAYVPVTHGPELLKHLERTQGLGFCLFKPPLAMQSLGPQMHHVAEVVKVGVIDGV